MTRFLFVFREWFAKSDRVSPAACRCPWCPSGRKVVFLPPPLLQGKLAFWVSGGWAEVVHFLPYLFGPPARGMGESGKSLWGFFIIGVFFSMANLSGCRSDRVSNRCYHVSGFGGTSIRLGKYGVFQFGGWRVNKRTLIRQVRVQVPLVPLKRLT